MNIEEQYLSTMRRILETGETKENRTGIDTLVIPTVMMQHDMSIGFPLLTTKKMYTRGIAVELEGFIKGITDKEWYQERGCNIWNEWSNPRADKDNDLGPIYGFQWRRYNASYKDDYPIKTPLIHSTGPGDQLGYIIRTLQENPNDRRMLCFAWNPLAKAQQALPACHLGFNVQHINGRVHLTWFQRSCDWFLGVPFNIASYALLLELICKHVGLEPGILSGVFCDTHIYKNHLQACDEQLFREIRKPPRLELPECVSIFHWTHEDMSVNGYNPHAKIEADVAV